MSVDAEQNCARLSTTIPAQRPRRSTFAHRIAAVTRCRSRKFRHGRSRFHLKLEAKLRSPYCKEQCYCGGSGISSDYLIHAIRHSLADNKPHLLSTTAKALAALGPWPANPIRKEDIILSRNMSAALHRRVLCMNTKCGIHPA
jgi:hypothetical protein